MSNLNQDQLKNLARLGAKARLDELRQEEAAIRAAFPDLFRGRPGRKPAQAKAAAGGRRRRRRGKLSAAGRAAIAAAQRRRWAAVKRQRAATKE